LPAVLSLRCRHDQTQLPGPVTLPSGPDSFFREERRVRSPNGRFEAVIGPEPPPAVTIWEVGGTCLFSGRDMPEFRFAFHFYPQHFLWSPDSKLVAIAAGFDRHIRTYVISVESGGCVHIPLPWLAEGYYHPWILPDEWITKNILRLAISGPHGRDDTVAYYRGEAKLHLTPKPPGCELLSQRIEELGQ
jgi:hypothetical protein